MSKQKDWQRDVTKTIARVASDFGFKCGNYDQGRNHAKVHIVNPDSGKSRYVTVSISPGCPRALKNTRTSAKKVCQELLDSDT